MITFIAGEAYLLTRERRGQDQVFRLKKHANADPWTVEIGPGIARCNCSDYRIRRRKAGDTCKHLDHILNILKGEKTMSAPQPPEREQLPALIESTPRPLTITEASTLGEVLFRSGYFADVRSSAQAVVKILAGAEMGFGPIASVSDVHIIEGKPSIGAHLRASAIKRSGKYDYRVVTLDHTTCELEFLERGKSIGRVRVTLSEMVETGLAVGRDGKVKSNWARTPDDMLFARAISKGYRRYCPDLTGGVLAYDPDELDGEPLPSQATIPPAPAMPVEQANGTPAAQPRTAGQLRDTIDALAVELGIPATGFINRISELYGTPDVNGLTDAQLADLEGRLRKSRAERSQAAAAAPKS